MSIVVGQAGPVTYKTREAANAGAKQEIQDYNELLPWRRQKVQHEVLQKMMKMNWYHLRKQPGIIRDVQLKQDSKRSFYSYRKIDSLINTVNNENRLFKIMIIIN